MNQGTQFVEVGRALGECIDCDWDGVRVYFEADDVDAKLSHSPNTMYRCQMCGATISSAEIIPGAPLPEVLETLTRIEAP